MNEPNGLARYEFKKYFRDDYQWETLERSARITAKRVTVYGRVFDRATFQEIRRKGDWYGKAARLLAYKIGDGPWVERAAEAP